MNRASFGNANIGEVYRQPGSRVKKRSPLASKPELGPKKPGLDPVDDLPDQRDGLASDKRQTAQKGPAPPLRSDRAQLDLVTIPGPHHRTYLADAVDQSAAHRHASRYDVACEEGFVRLVDFSRSAKPYVLFEGLMDVLLQGREPGDIGRLFR